MEPQFVSDVHKTAEESINSGLYCAESVVVVVALAKAQGIYSDLLPKVATTFCRGMSCIFGTFGAFTCVIKGASLALGRSKAG
jgi:hypothetical protein